MSSVDEIEALGRSVREVEQAIADGRSRILKLKEQAREAERTRLRAAELAASQRDKLVGMKRATVVDMFLYSSTRALYHSNSDLAESRRVSVLSLTSAVRTLEKLLPTMEADRASLARELSLYGRMVPLVRP